VGILSRAIEGYARGINPKYAAQQDAYEQRDALQKIIEELGPAQAHHPLYLANAMVASGNPALVAKGTEMMAGYHTGKTGNIKEFEYGLTLPQEQMDNLRAATGKGYKFSATKDVVVNGRPMLSVTMVNDAGDVKTVVTDLQVFQAWKKLALGGGQEGYVDINPTGSSTGGTYRSGEGVPAQYQSGGAPQPMPQGVPQQIPAGGPPGGAAMPPAGGAAVPPGIDPATGMPIGQAPATAPNAQGGTQGGGATTLPASPQTPPTPHPAAQNGVAQGAPRTIGAPSNTFTDNVIATHLAEGTAKRENERIENRTPRRNAVISLYETGRNVSEAIQNAGKIVDEKRGHAAGFFYGINPRYKGFELTGGSEMANLRSEIETIKANLSFDKMQELKAQSAQGATGLGPIAIPEFMALQSAITNLDQGKSYDELYKSLNTVNRTYQNLMKRLEADYVESYPEDVPNLYSRLEDLNLKDFRVPDLPGLKEFSPQRVAAADSYAPIGAAIRNATDSGPPHPTVFQGWESDIRSEVRNSADDALGRVSTLMNRIRRMRSNGTTSQQDIKDNIVDEISTKSQSNLPLSQRNFLRKLPIDELVQLLQDMERTPARPERRPFSVVN
jgi:hypothetical protein